LLGALGLWGPERVLRAGARLSARLRAWQEAFEGQGQRWATLLRPRVIGLVMASYVGIFLTYALRLYLLFTGLGLEVTAFQCAVAGVVLLGVTAIPLVPGSLGIREMAIGWVAGQLGMPALYGLTVGLIDRAVQLAVLLPLGAVFYAILFRRPRAPEPARG